MFILSNLLGLLIKKTPWFKGKGRLIHYWMQHRDQSLVRAVRGPSGTRLFCRFSVPYEAMIWLEQEEVADLRVLGTLLNPGDTFVDCGANIGLWSITAAKLTGETGRVFAFEPNPQTFARLAEHIRINRLPQVKPLHFAVGASSGSCLINNPAEHNLCQVLSSEDNNVQSLRVPMVHLDGVAELQNVHGMKIDVEGLEEQVLRGGIRMIERDRPWLCIEFNTLITGTQTLGDWLVHKFLCDLGYQAYFHPSYKPGGTNEVLQPSWTTTGYCNLLYIHATRGNRMKTTHRRRADS